MHFISLRSEHFLARRNRRQAAVVCGPCGARIGAIVSTADLVSNYVRFGQDHVVIQFDAGWDYDRAHNYWRFTTYASKRLKNVRSAKVRKYPVTEGAIHSNDVMDSLLEELPVDAECRDCRRMNRLSQEELRVRFCTVMPSGPRDETKPVVKR